MGRKRVNVVGAGVSDDDGLPSRADLLRGIFSPDAVHIDRVDDEIFNTQREKIRRFL